MREVSMMSALYKCSSCTNQAKVRCSVSVEDATEVWITIGHVMRAAVALEAKGQPWPTTVAVFSVDESIVGKDAWGLSEHQVYR